jgi:purine-cytosine permease-like protein
MGRWSEAIFYILLVYYCIFGIGLIDKYVFNHELSGIRLGLIMTVVFLSAYPIFGWKREMPRARWGQWTLAKWLLLGVGIGMVTIIADYLSHILVHHFSR